MYAMISFCRSACCKIASITGKPLLQSFFDCVIDAILQREERLAPLAVSRRRHRQFNIKFLLVLSFQHHSFPHYVNTHETSEVPSCFKHSTVTAVPKEPTITGWNDYGSTSLWDP